MTNQEAIDALQDMIDCVSSACVEQEWIDAIPLAITALKKQEPVKPNNVKCDHIITGYCGMCGNYVNGTDNYCSDCGQRLDWTEDTK